jgi:hypothetical protein
MKHTFSLSGLRFLPRRRDGRLNFDRNGFHEFAHPSLHGAHNDFFNRLAEMGRRFYDLPDVNYTCASTTITPVPRWLAWGACVVEKAGARRRRISRG